jgi:hypothetical protein
MEAVVIWHHVANRQALAKWPTLLLSPECVEVLEAASEFPDRPALIAVSLAYLIGDLDPELHAAAYALALDADALTLAQCLAYGSLENVVRCLQSTRLQLRRAA